MEEVSVVEEEWWEEVSVVESEEWWEEVVPVPVYNNYCIMASLPHIVTIGRSIIWSCYWLCRYCT